MEAAAQVAVQCANSSSVDEPKLRAALEAAEKDAAPPPVETGQQLVGALCGTLRTHGKSLEALTVMGICKILAKLLGREQAIDQVAINKGVISSMTAVMTDCEHEPAVVRKAVELLATVSTVPDTDTIINNAGSIQRIVEVMKIFADDTILLEECVTGLAVMAVRTRHKRAVCKHGGIPVLVDILKRYVGAPALVVAVCRFVSACAVKDEYRIKIMQDGGIEALIVAFDCNSMQQSPLQPADIRATVARALWACATDNVDVQNMLLTSGWIVSLASALGTYPDHLDLHEAAMGIIRRLSNNGEFREDIVSMDFVPTTVSAMKRFSSSASLLKEACGVISNLAADQDIRIQLGEAGIIEQVVDVLANCHAHEDRKVAKLALGALLNLSASPQNRALAAKCGAVQTLLHVQRYYMHTEMILELAIGAVSHLVMDKGCHAMFVEAGGVEAILLFLEEHKDDLGVMQKAMLCLRRAAHTAQSSPQAQALLEKMGRGGADDGWVGIVLVVEAMKVHKYDGAVVREAALLLYDICQNPAVVNIVANLAAEVCMEAVEMHGRSDPDVADAVTTLLASLPIDDKLGDWMQKDMDG
mmetsp:Transcript_20893/g.53080  ORF Transcript_20893/g.53080 Transcript_20893/m.53080 type:complete len:587 (-) Transcript_20893:129-1889(-)